MSAYFPNMGDVLVSWQDFYRVLYSQVPYVGVCDSLGSSITVKWPDPAWTCVPMPNVGDTLVAAGGVITNVVNFVDRASGKIAAGVMIRYPWVDYVRNGWAVVVQQTQTPSLPAVPSAGAVWKIAPPITPPPTAQPALPKVGDLIQHGDYVDTVVAVDPATGSIGRADYANGRICPVTWSIFLSDGWRIVGHQTQSKKVPATQCIMCARELSSMLDAYYGKDPQAAKQCVKCRTL